MSSGAGIRTPVKREFASICHGQLSNAECASLAAGKSEHEGWHCDNTEPSIRVLKTAGQRGFCFTDCQHEWLPTPGEISKACCTARLDENDDLVSAANAKFIKTHRVTV